MDRFSLIKEIEQFTTSFAEEKNFVRQFLDLLKHPRCFHRDHLPGHITGSAWIVNDDRTKVLLVHHAKLNRWLQPGGHADGEEDVLNVALREAQEETGVLQFNLLQEKIFDLDIHPIPARKDFPEHLHYDVRFLFQANEKDKIIISDESHDVKWILLSELADYNPETSIQRLAKKLFGANQ
jgi:8-oxo-dGTP pyrophosphatase MutT (NUDIX family)